MAKSSNAAPAPAIRTFQMDGAAAIGDLASAVNLFRGDVNLSQSLIGLPGLRAHDGLDVNIAIQYQSNVARAATTWNRDAPTSVLGLGWDMPLTRIEADGGSAVPSTRQYTLHDGGSPNPLFRQSVVPVLLRTERSLACALQSDAPVPEELRRVFLDHGLALDESAVVSGTGPWTVDDDVHQQSFALRLDAQNKLEVADGGELYQLQGYRFSKVIYYPRYERWLVVGASGLRRSFGGSPKPGASDGDSVAWSVFWTDASGKPMWSGPSTRTEGQCQVARAWYLRSSGDRFGNQTFHTYEQVQQAVGAGGLTYTKAVYPSTITDVFGRTLTFQHGEKSPGEYVDPHRATPSDAPGPYQDRYDTRFLAAIALSGASGAPMLSIRFDSSVEELPAGPKRLLRQVTMLDQDGVPQPGMQYAYYLDESAEGAQLGALSSVTYPVGGTVTYTYAKASLPVCDRTKTVSSNDSQQIQPRVFFGPDYTVVLFYEAQSTRLTLQVFTWVGRWLEWKLGTDGVLKDNGNGNGNPIQDLQVLAGQEILVVTYLDNADREVYVFNRDTAQPGQWHGATIDGKVTAKNTPSLTYGRSDTFDAGDTFFVVSHNNDQTGLLSYDRVTWCWSTQQWTCETVSWGQQPIVGLAAAHEYLAIVDSSGTITVQYLDGLLTWNQTSAGGLAEGQYVRLAAGRGMVAIANGKKTPERVSYELRMARWSADYTITIDTIPSLADDPGPHNPELSWTPHIVEDTLVAVNGNLLRFDGGAWNLFRFDGRRWVDGPANPQPPLQNTAQRYAYGPDFALQVLWNLHGKMTRADVLAFDPTSMLWQEQDIDIHGQPSGHSACGWPSVGDGDWAVLGPQLYFRGCATSWAAVFNNGQPIEIDVPSGSLLGSQALVNEAGSFLAFPIFNGQTSSAAMLTLHNGAVHQRDAFPNEKIHQGSGGPGTSPAGPLTIVSYPSTFDTFDDAGTVILRHYAGNAISGNITHYAVDTISLSDGFQDRPIHCSFSFDEKTAACDATGDVVKYYHATAYPGTQDRLAAPFGRIEHRYLNGISTSTAASLYSIEDGMLVEKTVYAADGSFTRDETSWKVYTQVASDPCDREAPLIQLRGGWVARAEHTRTRNGVSTTTTQEYTPAKLNAPYTGQETSRSQSQYGGDGTQETFTTTTRYAVETVPALAAIHAFKEIAQKTQVWTGSGATPVTAGAKATTHKKWPSALGKGVLTPAVEAHFNFVNAPSSDFPFEGYAAGDVPTGWKLAERTTALTPRGGRATWIDGVGTPTTTLYGKDELFAVAYVNNAAGDAAFVSFEPYEDLAGLLNDVTLQGEDVRTGTRAAVLPQGASITLRPLPTQAQTYVVGLWYKTQAGASPEVSLGAQTLATLPGTDGAWRYATVPFQGAGGGATITLTNAGSQPFLVDTLLVVPLINVLAGRTFDSLTRQATSTMDAGGRTIWSVYDRRFRSTFSVGAGGQVRELSQRFASRWGNNGDTFDPGSPSAELTLHAAQGGTLERFRDGGAWATRWKPSPGFRASEGALHTSGPGTSTLQTTLAASSYAVHFELRPGGEPAPLSIQVGDVAVAYDPSGGWTGKQGETLWTALGQPPRLANQWLLVVGQGVVLFFADGQLLFSRKTTPVGSTVVITTEGGVTFQSLALVTDVRLGVCYRDAVGRHRQVHQLHGADSFVAEVVFDALGRKVATTKAAPGSFGSGASHPVMGYRSGFVEVDEFLGALAGNWKMSGDVAGYYQDDEGYPYWGVRYRSSKDKQVLEKSLPGADDAIDLTVDAGKRATIQYQYGPNDGDTILPGQKYHQITQISQTKLRNVEVKDLRGQRVRALNVGASDTQSASRATRSFEDTQDGPRVHVTVELPNAQASEGFVTRMVVDAQRITRSIDERDAGLTRFIRDSRRRLRFVQPQAAGGEPAWFIYYSYDPLGRLLEEGRVMAAWDEATLDAKADDPSYPGALGVVALRNHYDGTGGDPAAIGKRDQSTCNNPDPAGGDRAITVTETFGYDGEGQMTTVTQSISGSSIATVSATIGYTFNALGEVTAIALPQGAPADTLYYGYDDQGHLRSIGTSPGASDLGSYQYDPNGDVVSETLDGGTCTRDVAYDARGSVGRLTSRWASGDSSFELAYAYDPDGNMSRRTTTRTEKGQKTQQIEVFGYDDLRRLASAKGGAADVSYTYDPNGNLVSLQEGPQAIGLPCKPGTNKLARLTQGGESSAFTYDAVGRMTGGLGRTLTYDETTNMTTSVGRGDTRIRLAYGCAQQRVLKQPIAGEGSTIAYFSGAGRVPIAQLVDGAWEILVHDPGGLAMILKADRRIITLRDHDETIWGAVDKSGTLAAYTYLPFGKPVQPDPCVVRYRFQGQEWDAEVGLYNFRARMYEPSLCRFLVPDPARQFASPYLFAANKPLMVTDPTGEFSLLASIFTGLAMVATAVAGVALSVVTMGAATPAVVAAEAAEGVAEAGAATAAGLATEMTAEGATATAEVTAEAATEGGAEAAAETTATTTEEAGSKLTSVINGAKSIGVKLASAELVSIGVTGLEYDAQSGRKFTAAGFGTAIGIAAATAPISVVLDGAAGAATDALVNALDTTGVSSTRTIVARALVSLGFKAVSGAVGSDIQTVFTNLAAKVPWYSGMAQSTYLGLAVGAGLDLVGSAAEHFVPKVPAQHGGTVGNQLHASVRTPLNVVLTQAMPKETLSPLVGCWDGLGV